MRRTFLVVMATLTALAAMSCPVRAQNDSSGHAFISPAERIVSVNDTFSLFIRIDTVRQVKSFLFDIEVDTTVIQLQSATRDPFFNGPSGAFFFWKDTTHVFATAETSYVYEVLSSLFGPTASVTGPGKLVRLQFKALNTGYSPVWLRVADLFDPTNTEIALNDSLHGLVFVCPTGYLFGDADFSGQISIADAVFIINYIFASGPRPQPIMAVGDADCSGQISIADAVYIINYIFAGGMPPCNPCS